MSFEQGNREWERRSKHGRDTLFESPELMWEAACEYFKWCEDNPFKEQDFVGKDVVEINRNKMRPFTMHGLCLYLGCGTAYFRNFKNEERAKKGDFKSVIEKIEETIYNQKFSGAAAGFLNANLIARDLGLVDKKELDASVKTAVQTFKINGQEITFE